MLSLKQRNGLRNDEVGVGLRLVAIAVLGLNLPVVGVSRGQVEEGWRVA